MRQLSPCSPQQPAPLRMTEHKEEAVLDRVSSCDQGQSHSSSSAPLCGGRDRVRSSNGYWGWTTVKRLGCWARELSVHGPCRPYEVPAQPRGLEQTCPLGKALVGGKGHPPKSLAGQPWETLTLAELQCPLTTPSRGQRVLKPQAVIGCFLTLFLYLLEKAMATHSTILAWKSPWTEEPGRLQSMGLQRGRHSWAISL